MQNVMVLMALMLVAVAILVLASTIRTLGELLRGGRGIGIADQPQAGRRASEECLPSLAGPPRLRSGRFCRSDKRIPKRIKGRR